MACRDGACWRLSTRWAVSGKRERDVCYSKCMLRTPARRMRKEQRRFTMDAILSVGIAMVSINLHLLERRVLHSDIVRTPSRISHPALLSSEE